MSNKTEEPDTISFEDQLCYVCGCGEYLGFDHVYCPVCGAYVECAMEISERNKDFDNSYQVVERWYYYDKLID